MTIVASLNNAPRRLGRLKFLASKPKLQRWFASTNLRRGQLSVLVRNPQLPRHDLQHLALNEVDFYAERFKHHMSIGSDHSNYSALFDGMTAPEVSDSVLVVSSYELASWIDDQDFISRLLGSLFQTSKSWGASPPPVVNVITAVACEVSSSAPGISIMHGKMTEMFPEYACHRTTNLDNMHLENEACLTFHMGALDSPASTCGKDAEPVLEVITPLANTLFYNGKRSCLQASKWTRTDRGMFSQTSGELSLSTQLVVPETTIHGGKTTGMVPLMAICPPREIRSSLGNILRQIMLDGKATPASKELEKNVDILIKDSPDPRPFSVWACITPDEKMLSEDPSNSATFDMDALRSMGAKEASNTSEGIPLITLTQGARLHQVLSGGGGWGAKQGLLSLDPDTVFQNGAKEEDAALEGFIQSFTNPDGDSASRSILQNGRYVQFFVNTPARRSFLLPETYLGVCDPEQQQSKKSPLAMAVLSIIGRFGLLSSQALYLRSLGKGPSSVEAKLNTIGTWLQTSWPAELPKPGSG